MRGGPQVAREMVTKAMKLPAAFESEKVMRTRVCTCELDHISTPTYVYQHTWPHSAKIPLTLLTHPHSRSAPSVC